MKRKSQLELFPLQWFEGASFGGSRFTAKRKALRPLSFCKPIHLILKSDQRTLLSQKASIEKANHKIAVKNGLKLKDLVVHSSDIHFHMLIPKRVSYVKFIREVASKISRLMKIPKLWSQLPYTLILTSKREVLNLIRYFSKNRREVERIERKSQSPQSTMDHDMSTS